MRRFYMVSVILAPIVFLFFTIGAFHAFGVNAPVAAFRVVVALVLLGIFLFSLGRLREANHWYCELCGAEFRKYNAEAFHFHTHAFHAGRCSYRPISLRASYKPKKFGGGPT